MISEYFSKGSPCLDVEACFVCTGAGGMHPHDYLSNNDKKFVRLNHHGQARAVDAQAIED